MSMKNIKLIVTDLDGTLLRRDKTISKYTVDVFRRVCERGVLTAFATARDFRFVTEHISPLFNFVPDILIADNGALARYNGKDLYRRLIPQKTANDLLSSFELIRCISSEKGYYLSADYTNDHWSIGKKDTIITDIFRNIDSDWLYVDGNMSNMPIRIVEKFPNIRDVTYSDVGFVTLVNREATKLNALIAVERALKINNNEIVAFGDDYSDVEILSYCSQGIAVANAIDEVKTVADHICGDCDEDGVARWIEENLL